MVGPKRDRERERYYLLPGMGGRNFRKKQKKMLLAAVWVGAVISLALGSLLYLLNR